MSTLSSAAGSPTYNTLSRRPGLITAGSTETEHESVTTELDEFINEGHELYWVSLKTHLGLQDLLKTK